MKALIFMSALMCFARSWTQDTLSFPNPKEMADYAFSATNFDDLPSQFLINRSMEMNPNQYLMFLAGDTSPVRGINNIGLFGLFEWWSGDQYFKRDSILFPVYDHFSTMDQERELHIPLYVTDMKVAKLRPEVWDEFTASSSAEPFAEILPSDVLLQHFETASIFLDSLEYNSAFLDFNPSTFISNSGRTVGEIRLRAGGVERVLYPGIPLSVSDWLSDGPVTIEIEVRFTDGSSFVKFQTIHWKNFVKEKSNMPNFWNTTMREYFDPALPVGITNPEGKFAIWYACDDKKLRKPYLMVTGWGTFTDKFIINDMQGFPTPMHKLVWQFNQDGLMDDLHAQGFDIVFVQMLPPNASIIKNSVVLEKIINRINEIKYANGSYEENIVMGVSAGALCARLTLQMMEKKHLEQNGPHPHTKLYVSYDGEHQGANVPLGMQHAVRYMMLYDYNSMVTDGKIYALHYILTAPLSQELLMYFHSETGSGSNPGQGSSNARSWYLAHHEWFDHEKNHHLPGYPSFQRMVSISNGQSVPNYNFSNFTCEHAPYPPDAGTFFFKKHGSMAGWVNRNVGATFLKHGVHRVFYYEYRPLFRSWKVGYEAKTHNPFVADNAPGGIIFIEENPIQHINQRLRLELTLNGGDIQEDHLFSFTPIVSTHDVKDLEYYMINGYPAYNFKERGLMYENESAAASNSPLEASDYLGYPHLGYPGSHYDYTPFDALFSWSENTEHLIGNRKSGNAYEGEWTEVRPVIKNFMVSEAEGWNIELQNKRIGYYARSNYTYRVDYEALNGIYLGRHITQKTDFYDMTSEPNAIVSAQAGVEIVFKAGVHLKAGTDFHAFIGDIACEKSAAITGNEGGDENPDIDSPNLTVVSRSSRIIEPTVYPNPNKKGFSVSWNELRKDSPLFVTIFDLTGKQLFEVNSFVDSEIKHDLSPGLYIVTVQNEDKCYSTRIVVE